MNTFVSAVKESVDNAEARTENGMKAREKTANAVLDLFSKIGSVRQARGKVDLVKYFSAAMAENEDLTLRVLLWARDIREGAGERKAFRDLLVELEKFNPSLARKVMPKIPELGRFDDLFVFQDYNNRQAAFAMIRDALTMKNSLCAKWCDRKGPVAVELTKFLNLSPKAYRKLIVGLTNVVETQMCSKQWDQINFSQVPSMASARYQKAFGRNASEKYSEYIKELQKPVEERDPKVHVNSGAVYPYDVVKSVFNGNKAVADQQWKALPNYVGDAKILPIVDVSGSMGIIQHKINTIQPIDVAVSLGLYLSDKNTGPFKDVFLTFTGTPEFVTVKGTLSQKIDTMVNSAWGYSTNLHAAFNEILRTAIASKADPEDMPETIVIFSDMQFDSCVKYDDSAIEMIRRKYEESGYKCPKVVFWNLNAQFGNTPVKFDERGTALVSGFSPSLMKAILSDDMEEYTPYNVMLQAIMKDRYAL